MHWYDYSSFAATLIALCFMAFPLQSVYSFILSRSAKISLHSNRSAIIHTKTHHIIMSTNLKRCANSFQNTENSEDGLDGRLPHTQKRHHRGTSMQLKQSTIELVDEYNLDESQEGIPNDTSVSENNPTISPPLYRSEGLLAVYKPLHWTSQDVVAYIRGILTRDAKDRGVIIPKSKKSKGRIKVGHGGTLDPLAEGVLVIGVGCGTKTLESFLSGTKKYQASVKLGFQTTTLDMEGEVTHEEPFNHVTEELIQSALPKFQGKIQQIPPVFSAIRKNGKKLYEEAREGKTAEDLSIESREVEIMTLTYLPQNNVGEILPSFGLDVECGGGTYIRSLVRDIGLALKTRATMTHLIRTKQGPYLVADALKKDEWTAERIAQAINTIS